MITRKIPSTNEELPILGLGTWKTFDKEERDSLEQLKAILQIMKKTGAKLIDSSPMYGNAEKVVGTLTADPSLSDHFFYATKVWTTGRQEGIQQMESSLKKMGRTTMDLMQIHNLIDWKTQLQTLRDWKATGKIRYIGITHYTDNMHHELERILLTERIDFVQFNYSIFSRHAEKSLLKMAADRGVATLINRPFGTGNDLAKTRHKLLPPWAAEYNIKSWSQFLLVYIILHPAVTVIIPATGDPGHAMENFNPPAANLYDPALRKRMATHIDSL